MTGYWWRAFAGRSWRAALATAVIGGLLGAVALGAVAGARRTATAYGRYLASVDASDAFVNVPGRAPGIPLARPITLISRLPGVVASAAYVGMDAFPVFHGKVDDSFQTNDLIGSHIGPSFTAAYIDQDRMTVLAGTMSKLLDGQPAVAGWSDFAFGQLPFDNSTVVPVLGVQQVAGSVEPPTTSGRPIFGNDQIELDALTMRALGKHVGDTVLVGNERNQRPFTIVGTVTLPSFGLALADHVSLGRGAMMSEQGLLAAQGLSLKAPKTSGQTSQAAPSAVAIDLVPGTGAAQRARLIRHITSANPDGTPAGPIS